eukprot:8431542-Heterocapsa_arctica.AAC.1
MNVGTRAKAKEDQEKQKPSRFLSSGQKLFEVSRLKRPDGLTRKKVGQQQHALHPLPPLGCSLSLDEGVGEEQHERDDEA